MGDAEPLPGRRGRSARASAATPENPAAPGQVGGQYRPLTEPQIDRIYEAALDLLSELGMGEAPPVLVEAACARGARVNELGRLSFPRAIVEDIIESACKSFIFYGRERRHDFEVGGERVYFGTGGAAVQTLDLESGLYRPSA